jgi:hypothetical protein
MDFINFTIFNIFIKNENVYMILSINNKEIYENEISIYINSELLTFHSKYVRNGPSEPILVFIYNNPFIDSNNNIFISEIRYNNIIKTMNIEYIKNEKYNYDLTLTTLFKDDYYLFPIFYEYYKSQGVEHFYMYYNGIITENIRQIFDKPDVSLIEWNFKYWLVNCKYLHHAQIGQIHDALYKYGKSNSKYMIFCDLDEYFNIENTTLKQFILENPEINTFGFCNIWSRTLDNKIPYKFPEKIMICDKKNYGSRSKNIYKTDKINITGIHSVMCLCDKNWTPGDNSITNLNMYHFFNWSKTNRHEDTYKLHNIQLIN